MIENSQSKNLNFILYYKSEFALGRVPFDLIFWKFLKNFLKFSKLFLIPNTYPKT